MNRDRILFLYMFQFAGFAGLFVMDTYASSQGIIKHLLFAVLFLTTISLFMIRFRFMNRLKRMVTELGHAANGNLNTRLSANEDELFNEVIFLINEIIDQMQKVNVQSIQSQSARKRLLSSISHDIRTPLTSIIGYIDALKDNVAVSPAEKQEYLDILAYKSGALKGLIDEMFHMAKIDADEVPLRPESLDFAEIARESLIEFLPEMKKQDMTLKVNIPEDRCYVFADRLSLIRIIGNVLKNAVQHGKQGKIVGVELIEMETEYQLLIWDQGPGIARADLKNVFERMYRSDQSRNPRNGGSGLGLAIAKALAEKNGGRIWAESDPWKRTSFGFSVPKSSPRDELRNN